MDKSENQKKEIDMKRLSALVLLVVLALPLVAGAVVEPKTGFEYFKNDHIPFVLLFQLLCLPWRMSYLL